MSDLPAGWTETTVGEICAMGPKSTWDDDMEIGFVPMSHAPTNFRDALNYETRPWHEVRKAYTHFENDDVIFAKVTPCFENGKAALASGLPNGAGAGSSEFHVLRRHDAGISPRYLLAVIKSAQFLRKGEENMTGAVGLRRVPRAFVENYPVPLPPEAEQKRIAQKLEALLAQVDTLKARIDAIPTLLKRLRQSVISAAVSGNQSETENAGAWSKAAFRDVITSISNGIGGSQNKAGKGLPVSRIETIASESINFERIGFVEGLHAETEIRHKLLPGDILFSHINSPTHLGKTAIFKQGDLFHGINLLRICVDRHVVLPEFFVLVCKNHRALGNFSQRAQHAVNQSSLNQKKISQFEIDLPTIEEQTEIIRRVEQLFGYADQLEAKVAAAQRRIDALTQSLLAKAFRGELVPQDPNDEPASVLLQRIRAQRAAAPKPKRGRKAAVS